MVSINKEKGICRNYKTMKCGRGMQYEGKGTKDCKLDS